MPGWKEVLEEIRSKHAIANQAIDSIRHKYLKQLNEHTSRNVITYYSGWLTTKSRNPNLQVNDADMNSFMSAVYGLDRTKGLDLILHTPGGDIAATERIVEYLWDMFDKDVRAIIPQIAMSAGTMIACSAKQIVMGKQSSLGPIDPQINGMPAQGILKEFQMATDNIQTQPFSQPLWQQIFSRLPPSFLVECTQAVEWSQKMVKDWLCTNMLRANKKKNDIAEKIVTDYLGDHEITGTHARHLSMQKCKSIGLKIIPLEEDQVLQDLVLTLHHAYMHSFNMTPTVKIVENHQGVATVISERESAN